MKGNMNHFLQAILNDILKNKEEKIPVEENIPATELSSNRLVKEKNEKRIETEQSQKKNSKEDEEFIAKLNILLMKIWLERNFPLSFSQIKWL